MFASAAPALHAIGLNVLPVDADTKRPLCPWRRWQTEQQTDAEVDRLQREFPRAGAAIVLGGPGLALADVEADSAAGEEHLRSSGLPLPPTSAFGAPRGAHRLYLAPGPLPRRVNILRDVDFLGRGYVLVPPTPGRTWLLGLDHLADLPHEWCSVFARPRRRCAPLPRAALRSASASVSLPVSHCSKRGEASHAYARLASSVCGLEVLRDVARVLGLPAEVGRAFRCPLPGHKEREASAAWWVGKNGAVVLMDFHRRGVDTAADAPPCFTVPEVFAAVRSGRTRKLRPPEHATWARRLLVESGLAAPASIPLPPLGPDARPSTRRVYDGIRLLFSARWLGTPGAPAPLSWRFLASWCNVGERQAGEAMHELLRLGVLRKAGTHKRTALFLPGEVNGR